MKELRLLQYNVQKSKNKVMVPLFEDARAQDFDIIAIQEPWQNPFMATTYSRRGGGYYLAYPASNGRA